MAGRSFGLELQAERTFVPHEFGATLSFANQLDSIIFLKHRLEARG